MAVSKNLEAFWKEMNDRDVEKVDTERITQPDLAKEIKMSNSMVVILNHAILPDEAEKVEDALVRTLHDMKVDAAIIDNVTGNTTTTDSYAEQIADIDEVMYDILIDLFDGERGYSEHLYYLGTFDEARRYGNSYLSTIWGEGKETVYYDCEDAYYNESLEVSAQLGNITPFALTAMTAKGTLEFTATWRVK